MEFRSATALYYLEVSPPPAVATFNDVPVSHPQFQFIEALAASGITARGAEETTTARMPR